MANPTPYIRAYDFTSWQATNPDRPLPGDQVDNELANIQTAIASTQSALTDIRRSDGALVNGVVTTDSLAADIRFGLLGAADLAVLAAVNNGYTYNYVASDTGALAKAGSLAVSTLHYAADRTGAADSADKFNSASIAAATQKLPLYVPGGTYLSGATSYTIGGSGFTWLNDNFDGGVNIYTQAQKSLMLLTGSTSTATPYSASAERTLLGITLNARGDNHGNPARFNLNNYSTYTGACTALYGAAVAASTAVATFCLHGETKHAGAGTTIALNGEVASYSVLGNTYGCVLNWSTSTAAATHPITGDGPAVSAVATALLIQGNTSSGIGQVGGWKRGIDFNEFALRTDAYGIRFAGAITSLIRSETTAISSVADINLKGNSARGIVLGGAYTNSALRIEADQYIGLEGTDTVRFGYVSSGTKWSFRNGATEQLSINTSTGAISVAGTQVVGSQATGYTAMTGTTNRGSAYDTASVTLAQLASRVKALQADLTAHGLIGA